jgi:prepilin-type processing-associated H-X9-DG protein
MTGQNKSKNLTFVEVLTAVLVCMFLVAVVVPAFQKPRSDAIRMTCLKNLSHMGRAMLIYSNDYDDEFPRAGGRNSVWGSRILNWRADNRFAAYGLSAIGSGGQATISSSFYLLVKYTEVMPKFFVCPGDEGTSGFKPVDYGAGNRKLIGLWDFGPTPSKHCSYAYHMPYGLYALTTSSEPGMAVAADRNPWIDSPAAEAKDIILFNPEGGREAVKAGNAVAHKNEGQNVLFVDGHVSFEESPTCGIYDDNIYTFWAGGDGRRGGMPVPFASEPADRLDSLLVNDPTDYRTTVTKEVEAIDSKDLKKTSVVATLDCPMPEHQNVIWCSTFQMAWDKLKNDIIGEPVKVLGAEEIAARLNNSKVSEVDLEEESFYATAGIVKGGIVEQIQKQITTRFPSATTPVFDELDRLSQGDRQKTIVAYAYLNVDIEFEHPFYTNDDAFAFQDSTGTRTNITSFRARTGPESSSLVREQVDILYYKYREQGANTEFVVDLCKHTQPYQVVLALLPRRNTLSETVAGVEQKIYEFKRDPDYKVLRKLRPIDRLIVPDVLYKLVHHFTELEGKVLGNRGWRLYGILKAMQMIDFALSRTGVTIKSQARIVAPPFARGRRRREEPRYFYFNRPFLVYVKKRQGGTNPFFVMWVGNAELMKEF